MPCIPFVSIFYSLSSQYFLGIQKQSLERCWNTSLMVQAAAVWQRTYSNHAFIWWTTPPSQVYNILARHMQLIHGTLASGQQLHNMIPRLRQHRQKKTSKLHEGKWDTMVTFHNFSSSKNPSTIEMCVTKILVFSMDQWFKVFNSYFREEHTWTRWGPVHKYWSNNRERWKWVQVAIGISRILICEKGASYPNVLFCFYH